MNDFFWMNRVFLFAKYAKTLNKIPIASILIYKNFEIGSAFNYIDREFYVFDHAEVICLKQAFFYSSNNFLSESILYTTINPCFMCLIFSFLCKIKNYNYCIYNFHNLDFSIYKIYICSLKKNKNILFYKSLFLLKKYFIENR